SSILRKSSQKSSNPRLVPTSVRSGTSSPSLVGRQAESIACELQVNPASSLSVKNWKFAALYRAHTCTVRHLWLRKTPAALCCGERAGDTALAYAKSAPPSWLTAAKGTGKSSRTTIRKRTSAPDVCCKPNHFEAADHVPSDIDLPPVLAKARRRRP